MLCSRQIHNLGLAGLAFLALALPVRAGVIAADALPIPNRVASADMVVVGKVTAIEDKPVAAAAFPGAKNKTEFMIAVVTVSDALLAPKDVKTVRLGFVPIPPMVAINPRPFQATVGMEGLFLTNHGEAGFLTAPGPLNFIDKKNPSFDRDVALVKRCVKLLADPDASLKAAKAEDRFLAAALLVGRYRARKSQAAKQEPINAEQSKLILQVLVSADWTPPADFTKLSPLMVVNRLSLTAKDGWMPPVNDPKAYAVYAQQWLKDNAGTYRIQRFVAENK